MLLPAAFDIYEICATADLFYDKNIDFGINVGNYSLFGDIIYLQHYVTKLSVCTPWNCAVDVVIYVLI